MTPRGEFAITIALLRGVEFFPSPRIDFVTAVGNGVQYTARDKSTAAENWLRHFGIHVGPNCEVVDLSTEVEP